MLSTILKAIRSSKDINNKLLYCNTFTILKHDFGIFIFMNSTFTIIIFVIKDFLFVGIMLY